MFESHYIAMLCALVLGGEAEVVHPYNVGYDLHRIRVDCETGDRVVEVGRDTRSSLDSIQQALFAAHLTGKQPMVVLIDTDGREGPYELRVRTAAEMAGVEYRVYSSDFLVKNLIGS
jgi:predicted RecB family endonuclease